jgi:hypothetical protein
MRLFRGHSSPRDQNGNLTVTWPVEWKGKKYQVIYSFSGLDGDVDIGVEPMVALFAQAAILNNFTLTSDEPISAVFHDNMTRGLVDLWKWWQPDKQWNLQLDMPTKNDGSTVSSGGVMSSFSGGVDSFHTLFSHQDEITDLLFVCGFDVTNDELLSTVLPKIRHVAASYNKNLIVVKSNIRSILPAFQFSKSVDWLDHLHGPATFSIVKCLPHCLFYFPSSNESKVLDQTKLVRGSGYRLDPLFGDTHQQIIHDGDVSRLAKTDFIAKFDGPMISEALRVCWKNNYDHNASYNCETCEKCMRTAYTLHLLGHLNAPCPAFPNWQNPSSDEMKQVARRWRMSSPLLQVIWDDVLRQIKLVKGYKACQAEMFKGMTIDGLVFPIRVGVKTRWNTQ